MTILQVDLLEPELTLAEAAARVIDNTADTVIHREQLALTPQTIALVARAYIETREHLRALYALALEVPILMASLQKAGIDQPVDPRSPSKRSAQ